MRLPHYRKSAADHIRIRVNRHPTPTDGAITTRNHSGGLSELRFAEKSTIFHSDAPRSERQLPEISTVGMPAH